MKRPSFQFYPADWRKDAALQSCSISAQGLWINIMCIAHECEPYGHMIINSNPMTTAQIGRLVGLSAKECQALVDELSGAGVLSITNEGALFSRRMVKDEEVRNVRAAGGKDGAAHGAKGAEHGKKGGRPRNETGDKKPPLHDLNKPPLDDDKEPPNNPPPSSSSSSSPSGITSDTVVSGADAPVEPAEIIFGRGVPLLTASGVSEKNARSMLGMLRKTHDDEDVIAALQACVDSRAMEPVAYLQGVLRAAKGATRPRTSRADERASWMASFWQPSEPTMKDMGIIDATC